MSSQREEVFGCDLMRLCKGEDLLDLCISAMTGIGVSPGPFGEGGEYAKDGPVFLVQIWQLLSQSLQLVMLKLLLFDCVGLNTLGQDEQTL